MKANPRRFPEYYITNAAYLIYHLPIKVADAMRVLDLLEHPKSRRTDDPQEAVDVGGIIGHILDQKTRRVALAEIRLARIMLKAAARMRS